MFVPLNQMFLNGSKRIEEAAQIRLIAHHCAVSYISGDAYQTPRLLVKTDVGIFVYVGGLIFFGDDADLILIKLLHDPKVTMDGPVRVVALEVLRAAPPG